MILKKILLFVAVCAAIAPAMADVTLVKDGKPAVTIVVPADDMIRPLSMKKPPAEVLDEGDHRRGPAG